MVYSCRPEIRYYIYSYPDAICKIVFGYYINIVI